MPALTRDDIATALRESGGDRQRAFDALSARGFDMDAPISDAPGGGGFRESWRRGAQALTAPIRSLVGEGATAAAHTLIDPTDVWRYYTQGGDTPTLAQRVAGTAQSSPPPSRARQSAETAGQFVGGLAGEMAVPSTPEGGVLSALQLIPLIGQAANLPRAVRAGIAAASAPTRTIPRQLLTMPAIGAGVAGATGGSPAAGALEGLASPVAGFGARAVQGGRRLFGDVETRLRRAATSRADADSFLASIQDAVPALRAVRGRNPVETLHLLQDDGLSKRALSRMFGETEARITTELGQMAQSQPVPIRQYISGQVTPTLNLPDLALATRGQALLQQGLDPAQAKTFLAQRGQTAFELPDVFAKLKDVAYAARVLRRSGANPNEIAAAYAMDTAVDQEFRTALTTLNRPDLAAAFADASTQYRRGVKALSFIDELFKPSATGRVFPASTTEGLMDAELVRELARSGAGLGGSLPYSEFPGVHAALTKGYPIGAGEEVTDLFGRVYAPSAPPITKGASVPLRAQLRRPIGQPMELSPLPPRLGAAGATGLVADPIAQLFPWLVPTQP